MVIRYAHTNIIAADWKRLVRFYCDVFGCVPVPPERNLSGDWLDRGTGVAQAHLTGEHLRLPGYGDAGPTLEIFSYETMLKREPSKPNRMGIGHLAFEVEDVREMERRCLEQGGGRVGTIAEQDVPGAGHLTFTYVTDPEGNIIELQHWDR